MSHSLIFAECKTGQKKEGVERGSILHELFLDNVIKDFYKNRIYWHQFEFATGYKLLYTIHQDHLHNNLIPITLGGDHSIGHITVGSSLQKYKDDILILWIDAHADINTLESSISKNTHGTPLSGLIGLENPWIPEITHLLKPSNLVYYGIRDLDEFEKNVLIKHNIKTVLLTELKELIKLFPYVHISFDVDSIDQSFIDSTGTVAKEGITPDEVIECFKICKDKIVAFDITEFNPLLGDYQKSINTMKYIIDNIIY
jgi:arginase